MKTRTIVLYVAVLALWATLSSFARQDDVTERLRALEKVQKEQAERLERLDNEVKRLRSRNEDSLSDRTRIPSGLVDIRGAAIKGRADARIVLVEFTDFQCPFCAAFANTTLPILEKEYVDSGDVVLAEYAFPLSAIHPWATAAAEIAECAKPTGRYWQIHDWFFSHQALIGRDVAAGLAAAAGTFGLGEEAVKKCRSGLASAKIRHDVDMARSFGLTATPTFFVGMQQPDGKVKVTARLNGNLPIQRFRDVLVSLHRN